MTEPVRSTPPAPTPPAPTPPARARANQRRGPIVAVLVLALLASAGTRQWADARREAVIPHRGQNAAGTSLSSMNSFALGLLLGGLRGPLVMILWTDSETQKTEKNLEGVETEIEWIRLLQPEFDTVHLFQIWNKAYNISVQMATLANKYATILGALDYAHSVDHDRPDDINIIATMGQLFFDKFGTSSERNYYRARVRRESQPHAVQLHNARDANAQRLSMDPVLDEAGDVLPALTRPVAGRERPAELPASQEWDDGSELQYLPHFQPYRDGVSTFGFAYNYYKRSEVLLNVAKQHHDQISDVVIDSRPPLALKKWAEDELEQGRRRELQAFGVAVPDDTNSFDFGAPTANLPLDRAVGDHPALDLAIFDLDRAARLAPDCIAEYVRHVLNYPYEEQKSQLYRSEITAEGKLAAGDADYLRAMVATPADRPALLASAKRNYDAAVYGCELILLRFYTEPALQRLVLPPNVAAAPAPGQKPLESLTPQQAGAALANAAAIRARTKNPYVDSDRFEYEGYIRRALTREQLIGAASKAE